MFIDQARIFVQAGNGGDGKCSFRREKFVPFGGPDGGDGGHGSDIVMTASYRATTLLDLKYRRHYVAESGKGGQGSDCHGRAGTYSDITVPVGTVVKDEETGKILGDFTVDGQSIIIAKGGKGGKGNARFASSTNRAPREFETGTPGEAFWLTLELKLLADVGLVGFPNAGKSTLISAISAARPQIADYPFTTLQPYLGVVAFNELESFVIADIPGIIEGAHEGKGLGFQFLRHIQRTAFLLYLVDCSEWAETDPIDSFEILRQELSSYDPHLGERSFAIVGTKQDIQGDGQHFGKLQQYCQKKQLTFFPISSATREGLTELIQYLGVHLKNRPIPCANNT
ncbi:MAG: GTPase ObgE [Nitrospirae bacterium]|nr:GTPase ObgE [Nitrospirota bacterium]